MTDSRDGSARFAPEDWVSVWQGCALILVVVVGIRPAVPDFSWTAGRIADAFSWGDVAAAVLTGLLLMAVSAAGIRLMGGSTREYLIGFPAVFVLAWAARLVAGNGVLREWGSAT